ncbi:MAG: ThuA domain-containing protein [Gracilimonas sp.]|nr:ThuA domain-containing protein [Gracilimonas sp.]
MKKFIHFLLIAIALPVVLHGQDTKVLIFSKTEGFRHQSIPNGIAAIEQLGVEHQFTVDATENASNFTFENLINYDAVIFLSTTGNVLNNTQQSAFEEYIQNGGGYVGIHAASDTEYNWSWYGDLVGAYFDSHPSIQEATIEVADKVHPSTSFLPDRWVRTDEWYNFGTNPRGDVHVLATLAEETYSGGNMGYDHPISWMHSYDGGRAWYTGGGHTTESFSEENFLLHILGGIRWAAGVDNGIYEATVNDKYQVTVLDNNPIDPLQLVVLPNRDLLYIERGGVVKFRSNSTGLVHEAAELEVDSGREDGLIGIALDPDFESNNWVYLFYSPSTESIQRLSRFTYENQFLNMGTEKVLLEFPVQRDECCHSGGDMEFDGDGNLFLATGDNTNPFQSDGYAPIDERNGREAFDAQRTSGNTNDLRGKILRIHPENDGTYSIPEGNLFVNEEDGLPEIFVMGTRNPFRMAVNKINNELVWGDVGPDANTDNNNRGPRGYDEFNRTKTSGNFGWPFVSGDNFAYHEWDFASSSSEGVFDPLNLINNSPNNTGATELPPARPAWLYYPYGYFGQRPEFGNQSNRTAIGGDFYHFDSLFTDTGGLPEYFDGTLFILEWTRNWIREVRLDSEGNLLQINPFLSNLNFNRPIDMHIGPDGAIYIIEWGTGFNGGNEDARIIRIEFVDNLANRPPIARASASITNGGVPLDVEFSASNSSDPDPEDELSYTWDFDGNGTVDATTENASYTYEEVGSYTAQLTVSDSGGETAVDQIEITAGNTQPEISLLKPVNGGFYKAADIIDYEVSVTDADQDNIDCNAVTVEPSIGHDDHAHGVGAENGCKGSFTAQSHGEGPDNVFYVLNAEFTDDGGQIGDPLTAKASAILQRKQKQAQHYQETNDTQLESTGDYMGGGQNVGFINHNSWLKYSPLNFQDIDYMTLRYASLSNTATVEVRANATNGPLIATFYTEATGAWQEYDYFTTDISDIEGTHDIYIIFKNSQANVGLGNLNWMEFHGKGIAKNDQDSLKGLAASYFGSTDFSGSPSIRKEPMIAWNWASDSPMEGIPENNFSVRWEGEIVAPTTGNYTLSVSDYNGNTRVWIDDEEIINVISSNGDVTLTEGEAHTIKVEYVHRSGSAGVFLRWSGNDPEQVIHMDYLRPDTDLLTVSNEYQETNDNPGTLSLQQNYPNPFNPSTKIEFSIPEKGDVNISVYNMLGQIVQTLVDEPLNSGQHTVTFDAKGLSSGIYFYRLHFSDMIKTGKMVLMK